MRIFSVKHISHSIYSIALVLLIFTCSSCGTTRPYTYMQGSFDTAKLSQINLPEPIIQKGDILSIIVYSDNPSATAIYNQALGESSSNSSSQSSSGGSDAGSGTTTSGTSSPSSGGYLVDENGNIEFQGLGKLHVEGLTRMQLKELLDSRLKEYLKNPYYSIRFLNYHITMLGEVNHPGILSIPGDHVNLLEALAIAGDMGFYARRDNILIIRTNNNKREFARLDITKPEIMASPFFNLQQNDMVIVEANKKKSVANDQSTIRTISIATSLISVFAIIYSIFKK
ncbi:MAG: polysaccharide biosynthesis/export family protein [Bacteroidetes bacterium]|nr:polysaccharide biosynthesis/export family protein [Bacteroidota bacterium]